jgi:GLPGLI family protein
LLLDFEENMTKLYLALLCFLFFYSRSTAAQSLHLDIRYSLSYKEDSLNLHRVQRDEMLLQVRDTVSCFQSSQNFDLEKKKAALYENMLSKRSIDSRDATKIHPKFSYRIFKGQNGIFVEEVLLRKTYAYTRDVGEWEILDVQDSVAGYWSQKARISVNGRNFEAWFTTAVPVSDGPYIFHGLPGLIVKVYDKEEHYVFTIAGIAEGKSTFPSRTKGSIRSSFSSISALKKQVRQDPAADPLINDFFSGEALENLRKKASRNNNPLEVNQ